MEDRIFKADAKQIVDMALFPEYDYDIETSLYLRSKATLWWFKNTIMFFKKKHNG
jgi:hypothetical protein